MNLKTWIAATRPPTLTAAVAPVAVGTTCALTLGPVDLGRAGAAALAAVFIQIGTNFANDLFDARRGADGPDRLGPTRAVATGAVSDAVMLRATAIAFGLAVVPGLYLAAVCGWPAWVIGVASIVSGVCYTGGPAPLAYNGLADAFVMLFFGFVAVCGSAWVQLGYVPSVSWIAGLALGSLTTAVLVVNNLRDRVQDARVGKRTLAVRFGARAAKLEYVGLVAVAHLSAAGLALYRAAPWMLLPLLTLPLSVALVVQVHTRTGRALNGTLARTAASLLLFGGLLCAGLWLSRAA